MKWFILGSALVAVVLSQAASLPPFLNCDGTGIPGWNALNGIGGPAASLGRDVYRAIGSISTPWRECCVSSQLPNGCECFDVSPMSDFFNLMGMFKPLCPPELGVKFFYYSKANKNEAFTIRADDDSISKTDFDPSRLTKIIVHGWGDFAYQIDYIRIREAIMDAGNFNIILVEWGDAAGHVDRNFFQSVANVRSVGAMLGHLISTFKNKHNMPLASTHLICSHLGAQVCGFAGKEVLRMENQKVARITALDAVGVGFEGQAVNARLDKTDADFVDAMHCDGGPDGTFGLGMTMSYGHVDFRPNGGAYQPGCPKVRFGYFDIILQKPGSLAGACSHYRANQLFISSVKQCHYHDPKNEQCEMGWLAKADQCKGEVILYTAGTAPFCSVPAPSN